MPVPKPQRSFVIIPARLASTRLPRKLLLAETGKPLLQHAYEAACRATLPAGVCVAADGEEIAAAVRRFGGQVVLTDPELPSGSDRIAAVARTMPDVDIVVNVQGDEPELSPAAIDSAVQLLLDNPSAVMSTLCTPIREEKKLHDPACVKVVCDSRGKALYFSRAPIPYPRTWDSALLQSDPPLWRQHLGLYAYRRDFLLQLAALPRSAAERAESLEQLRVLDAGCAILVGQIDEPTIGVDTPEDYRDFVTRYRAQQAQELRRIA